MVTGSNLFDTFLVTKFRELSGFSLGTVFAHQYFTFLSCAQNIKNRPIVFNVIPILKIKVWIVELNYAIFCMLFPKYFVLQT